MVVSLGLLIELKTMCQWHGDVQMTIQNKAVMFTAFFDYKIVA